jgi:hypothetical protein
MDLLIVLPMLLGIAVVFVLLPVAAAAYSYYRRPKVVRCPEAVRDALVRVSAARASLHAVTGRPEAVVESCSLWPHRRECAQACVSEPMRRVTARA